VKTIFEECAEKLKAAIEADADLTTFMTARHGKSFWLDKPVRIPWEIHATDCPALVVSPGEIPFTQATNRDEDYKFTMAVELRTAEPDVWTMMDFFVLVTQIIVAQRGPTFGLTYLYDVGLEQVRLVGLPADDAAIQWRLTANLVFHIRRDARRLTLWAEAP